ncbi:MAG: sensor histidine kinase [Reyranellaceae bacterium]
MSAKTESDAPDEPSAGAAGPDRQPPHTARLSLRVRLLLLVVLATVPAIVASTVTAFTRYESDLNGIRANLRALSILAVNRHLETLAQTNSLLQTVARLPEIVSLDAQRCPVVLSRLHGEFAERYTNIAVVEREGAIRCSAVPIEPGRKYSNPEQLRTTLAQNRFVIGGIIVGGLSGERLLSAATPIGNAGGPPESVVITGIRASYLNGIFDSYQLPAGSQIALVDKSGEPLANPSTEAWRLPSPSRIVAALASGTREFAHDAGGQPYLVVLNPIGDYDVYVLAALPSDVATGPVTWRLIIDMGQILAFALLAAIGALLGARYLVLSPIARFRGAVRAYRRDGRSFSFERAKAPQEIVELADEFATMARDVEARQENLQALLRQRDLLVRETNHRVKNNLQIVASLLSLQSRRITEPGAKAQFDLARQRVATLALLHRHLYEQRDTETVNLRTFFEQLMVQLVAALGHRARYEVDVPDFRVPPSIAIPLGLIVTEAVTNTIKYAFPDGRQGSVRLTVTIANGRGHLAIEDDGIGLGGDSSAGHGMGDVLMRGFADQVSGTLSVDAPAGGGTRISLDFQLEEPAETSDEASDAPARDAPQT